MANLSRDYRSKRMRNGALYFVAAALFAGIIVANPFSGAQTLPSTVSPANAATAAALDLLKNVVEHHSLEMSTLPTSIADRFCFEMTINFTANIGQPSRILIIRDHDKAALLVRTLSGGCYTYCTNGLVLTIDHDHPGYLMRTTACPLFLLNKNENGFQFNCGFDQVAAPTIKLALSNLFAGMISSAKVATYDAASRRFTVQTAHSLSTIELSHDDSPFPIRSFTHQNKDFTMEFSFLSCGTISRSYAMLVNPDSFEKSLAGIQIENIAPADSTPETFSNAATIPSDLGQDPAEQALVTKLTEILVPANPATQPAKNP